MNSTELTKDIKMYASELIYKLSIDKKSKSTLESYNRIYNDFINFLSEYNREVTLNSIKERDIYSFMQFKEFNMNKQGELAISTKNLLITTLKRLFSYIERNSDEMYDFDKVFEDIKIKKPKREPKGLTKEQSTKLLTYFEVMKLDGGFVEYRNILLLKLMLFGGLRVSEALSIKFSDFCDVQKSDKLYGITLIGKGDKKRTVYADKKYLYDEIDYLLTDPDCNYDIDDFIGLTSSLKKLTRVQLSQAANIIYKKAGLKNVSSLHILRHTYAKQMVEKVSLPVLQRLMGHGEISTTAIYTNPTNEMIIDALIAK